MAAEPSPAYQWYVKDWRSSRKVQLMSFKVRGMYREMLDEQWDSKGSLPNDALALAVLLGGTETEWTRHLPQLRLSFTLHEGRLINDRLERVRKELNRFKRGARKGGRNRVKTATRSPRGTFTHISAPADIQPPAGVPIQAETSTATSSSTATATAPPIATATARSKRPIFTGQKLTVFEWMLDDCTKTLGVFTDSFDLHSWFFDLDQRAYETNLVMPKRDGGAWLQAELVSEAHRRGIPLHIATADPPKIGLRPPANDHDPL